MTAPHTQSNAEPIPRADAWRLACLLCGAPPYPLGDYQTDIARGAAVAIAHANGEGPDGAWRTYLLSLHDTALATAWQAAVFAEDPNADEPVDSEEVEARYRLRWAAEALQPRPPIAWVVEGIIARKRVHCLFGDGGSKKTWTCTDLGVNVALERDAWLGFALHGGRVLWTDEEAGEADFVRRLALSMHAHAAPADLPLAYTNLAGFDLRNEADLAALENLIATLRPALWVIDALQDLVPGADENSTKDMGPPLRWLKRIADRYDLAIVVIHHSGRDGTRYRGSSAIKQLVDVLIRVESKDDSPNIDFASEKCRDGSPFKFAAASHFHPEHVHLTRTGEERPRLRLLDSEQEVLHYLEAHDGRATGEAIAYGVDTISPATAHKAIKSLVKRNLIHRANEGGKGVEAEYALGAKPAPETEVPW